MYPWKLWPLRDDSRSDKEVIRYLQAENAYADATLAHTKPLQEQTYKEIVGRIKQDDSTVPYRKRGYWYYRRYDTGKEYPIYAQAGDARCVRAGHARRERNGKRSGALPGGWLGSEPGQPPARLDRGHPQVVAYSGAAPSSGATPYGGAVIL
jgi:hypothetical protein